MLRVVLYLFKINNKYTIKADNGCGCGVFIVNYEHIQYSFQTINPFSVFKNHSEHVLACQERPIFVTSPQRCIYDPFKHLCLSFFVEIVDSFCDVARVLLMIHLTLYQCCQEI